MMSLNRNESITAVNPQAAKGVSGQNLPGHQLGQADFIELLVAQVKNQDPTKPMEPSQFMNQLAQFSTVNGITELQKSFDSLAVKLSSDQSLQAAGLVGRDVLLSSESIWLDAGAAVDGQIDLPAMASEVKMDIFNSSGELVASETLGGHGKGTMQFHWDGLADDGSAVSPGNYRLAVNALIDGAQRAVETRIVSQVDSVSIDTDGTGLTLNLAGGGSVPFSKVYQIR